jgi:hypothetical protein
MCSCCIYASPAVHVGSEHNQASLISDLRLNLNLDNMYTIISGIWSKRALTVNPSHHRLDVRFMPNFPETKSANCTTALAAEQGSAHWAKQRPVVSLLNHTRILKLMSLYHPTRSTQANLNGLPAKFILWVSRGLQHVGSALIPVADLMSHHHDRHVAARMFLVRQETGDDETLVFPHIHRHV